MTDHHFIEEWKKFLEPDLENSAEEWLEEKNPEFVGLLFKFKLGDREVFPKQMFSETLKEMSPSEWWDNERQGNQKQQDTSYCRLLRISGIPSLLPCKLSLHREMVLDLWAGLVQAKKSSWC
jgi:hypothetical protein